MGHIVLWEAFMVWAGKGAAANVLNEDAVFWARLSKNFDWVSISDPHLSYRISGEKFSRIDMLWRVWSALDVPVLLIPRSLRFCYYYSKERSWLPIDTRLRLCVSLFFASARWPIETLNLLSIYVCTFYLLLYSCLLWLPRIPLLCRKAPVWLLEKAY